MVLVQRCCGAPYFLLLVLLRTIKIRDYIKTDWQAGERKCLRLQEWESGLTN